MTDERSGRFGKAPELTTDFDAGCPVLVHNRLTVAGWGAAADGIASVTVRIAEHEIAADTGIAASGLDDAPGRPPQAGAERFSATVDTTGWSPGSYPFAIVATDRSGAVAELAAVAEVRPYAAPPIGDAEAVAAIAAGRPAMWCETPNLYERHDVVAPFEVAGWAWGPGGVDEVLVTIDDRISLRAVHGLVRPDLRARLGDAVAEQGGFAIRIDPLEFTSGPHELTVVAVTREGAALGMSGTLTGASPKAAPRPSPSGAVVPLPEGRPDVGDGRFTPAVHRDPAPTPEHRVRYAWAASLVAGAAVLDVGCGVGRGTSLLAQHARRAVGLDLSPVSIAEAVADADGRAEFSQGDMLALPFADGEFDAVTCFEAIEHVSDPERALDEMRRVLRPGGLLLISSANRGAYPPGNPLHLSDMSSAELRSRLAARFANVAMYGQQSYLASLLGTDGLQALDDASTDLDASVAKAAGGPPGSELYAIGVASDGDLPAVQARVVLGGAFDRDEQIELTGMWQQRCIHAEADAAAMRSELNFVRGVQRQTAERLQRAEQRVAELEAEAAQPRRRP